ncbi:hypothetical protein CMU07_09010 [Elizabethkingia anophelis]|nr:hypothetical protein [Elizabethkingia anophelis]
MNKNTQKCEQMEIDKNKILDQLTEYKGFRRKAELASFLGIKPNVLSNWYSRNTFDEKIIISKFPEINKVWILTGEGSMLEEQQIQENNTTNFEKLPIEEKLNSIYELLINSSTNSNNSVESLIHGLISKDAHQDKYINFMRDKIIELESSLESQKNMTIQILEIVKDLKLPAH